MLYTLLKIFILANLALAFPTSVRPPTEDSFYAAPDGFESAQLGAILKYRTTPGEIKSIAFDVKIKNAWQLLVRSQDSFGNPSVIVTTVFEPFNADSSKLVSYQVAQDSAYLNCAPSYAFQDGGGISTITSQAETLLVQTALDLGYYVVSPDYEGLKSVFTGGIQAGQAVLNSITATLASGNITGISSDAQTVIWGYSGGSLASGWAAALQPNYAPALSGNIIGAALGGWVTNITATVDNVSGTIFAGLGAAGIAGLSNEYSEMYEFLKTAMYDDKYKDFTKAYGICMGEDLLDFAFHDFFMGPGKYFKDGISVLNEEPVAEIIKNNTLGLIPTDMPTVPIFVYHGEIDNLVPFSQAERVYDIWCDQGIKSFEFAVDETAGHVSEIIQGSGAAFAWVQKRFAGVQPVSGCQRTDRVNNLLYPGTDQSLVELLLALGDNVFGHDIGPNGDNLKVQDLQQIKTSE